MSIELMKKLDDLEQSQNQYSEKLSKEIDRKKAQYIKDVIDDFSKFFQEKGFTTKGGNNVTEATYGKLKAKISHDDPSTDYMGVYFRFELDLTTMIKSKINIVLNDKEPRFSMSFQSSSQSDSEEARLREQISRTEKEIEKVSNRLETINNENWKLFIKDDNQNLGHQFSEPFASMYDLLTTLIK